MLLNQLIENVFTNHPTFANQENFIEHPSEKKYKTTHICRNQWPL